MIISPPFLPIRATGTADAVYVAAAMPVAATNCPGTSIPEGSFPVSLQLGWHGGTHLHAPSTGTTVLPVRAIADGEIVFARAPTVAVTDPTHPLNYNPYGSNASWTDDGMVIVRHRTDIGTAANAESVEFYSLLMHLSALRGNALKVARGSATADERHVYRKDELGLAGRIYGAADHVQLEIVCDDPNLNKLVGRRNGVVDRAADGRHDSVYGEVYFHVPAGARLFAEKPHGNVVTPTAAASETIATAVFVGMRYASGDGAAAQCGSAWMTTYQEDGTVVGTPLEDPDADYALYKRATDISAAYPAGAQPAPSAVYEILRFGRILNTPNEVLQPDTCPHWRQIRSPAGVGWINLNAAGVHKFSDADFPDWRGWKLIDDDTDEDSRSTSADLAAIIEDGSAADGKLTPEELQQRVGLPDVRLALARAICKFQGEWNRDTIDGRWGWLQSDPDHAIVGEDWTKLRAHISALTVPAGSLPAPLASAHWHFHPQNFIVHFRQCTWLSAGEFKQMVPRNAMRRHAGTYLWEAVQTNLTAATSVFVSQRVGLNRMTRKYGINSPWRLASFYGNAIQETQWLGLLSEGGGPTLWYAPWYGRGFLQLTNPENFTNYWRFRGRQVPDALKTALTNAYRAIAAVPVSQRSNAALADAHFPQLTEQMRGWRDEVRGVAAAGSTDSTYAPSDSAGFYWAKLRMASYADEDHVLTRVAVTTNQGGKVYYRSPSFWRASAAVNLPGAINNLYSNALNGFDARCVAYAYSIAVLSEKLFPDSSGNSTLSWPEGYTPRKG
jgi:predicted chitinase